MIYSTQACSMIAVRSDVFEELVFLVLEGETSEERFASPLASSTRRGTPGEMFLVEYQPYIHSQ